MIGLDKVTFSYGSEEDGITKMGVEELLERRVQDLSSGQKQRVAIAAALVLKPPILILDEPISNLDSNGITVLLETLRNIKRSGTTIVISEHRLHSFHSLADKYVHIEKGHIVHTWNANEFRRLTSNQLIKWGLRHSHIGIKVMSTNNSCLPKDVITINKLSYTYKNSSKGFSCVDFKLSRGSVTALLGENGAGKTTLCKVLCGLLKQKEGNIIYHNKSLSTAQRQSMSYLVMQDPDYQLYTDSVGNELLLGHKVTEELKKTAYEALDMFNLTELKDRHPASLSGGEKQRVTMAAAYCSSAKLIILDEPTSGMDGNGVLGIAKWVTKLANSGKFVVIITHDELLRKMVCHSEIYMHEGRIV